MLLIIRRVIRNLRYSKKHYERDNRLVAEGRSTQYFVLQAASASLFSILAWIAFFQADLNYLWLFFAACSSLAVLAFLLVAFSFDNKNYSFVIPSKKPGRIQNTLRKKRLLVLYDLLMLALWVHSWQHILASG